MMHFRRNLKKLAVILVIVAVAAMLPSRAAADVTHETIANYQGYIIKSPLVTAWYGNRVALVIDGETAAQAAAMDLPTMTKILAAFDNLFNTYDQITGFSHLPIGHPLKGKITIEISQQVGGGLANHGVMGIAAGGGFFQDADKHTGLYYRVLNGQNTYDQVFFYESSRNYWVPTLMQKIDYATSTNADSWGQWTVGFNNAMSVLAPKVPISGISDMYYFGRNGTQFAAGMLANITTYINNPQYTWANSWDVDRLPWNTNITLNDLMTGLILQLAIDHGGTNLIKGLYAEIPRVPDLASDHADTQGARDNFYIAASRAAGVDLRTYFAKTLKWPISASADANYSRWTGSAGGQWDADANWTALAPTAFPNASTVNVAIDGSRQTSIDLHGNRTIKSLRFDGLTAASFNVSNSVPGSGLIVADGGNIAKDTNTFIGAQTISTPITINGAVIISNNSSWNHGENKLILSGPISGNGTIHFKSRNYQAPNDGGIELIANNSAYTGALYLDSGRLLVGNNNALGNAATPLVINGGDVWFADGISTNKNFIFAANANAAALGSATLGTLTLAGRATIDLQGGKSDLHFADSNQTKWSPAARLLIKNWQNGRHIRFGQKDSALTRDQLKQVGFVDPPSQRPGIYLAEIDSNGELKPSLTAVTDQSP